MKKIVIVVGGILVLAALGSPFFSGLIMERVVRDSFNNLNQRYAESGHDVRAEITRYDRGFSSSEIEWRIKSGSLKAIYDVDELVFVDRAEHGLAGITTRTSLEKNRWYADLVKSRLGGKDPLHITTTYKMAGGIDTSVAIDAFTIEEQGPVTVKPGHFAVALDREFKSFSSEGAWEGMEVAGKGAVAGVTLKSQLTMLSPYIWDGEVHMAMQDARVNGASGQFEVANLKVGSVIKFAKEQRMLSATAEYSADSLAVGPEKIERIVARFGVGGLNGDRYEEFMKLHTAAMRALFSEMAAVKNDPQKMREAVDRQMANMSFQLVAAGEKLLTKGLELQLSGLHLQVPEGEITGDVFIRLKKDMTFAQFIPVVNQPKLALDFLELKTAVSLPEKLTGDVPLLFSPVYPGMQTGLFVKNGGNSQHAAETKDGKLLLNGKEVLWQ